ncbi:MAG: hypothetical protein OXU33_04520 [Gemmatimonadota bacterium]|nr:hypothetical protein [Gemmatimonadota bacterium]MDE3005590.1 hypothetical protein [Gemmatimonadota bacterium]MDE3013316.1 hypothetical protein [Gemmatimonadota bacterium]
MTVLYLILTGLIGLGIGLWFGMPGRYTQSPDEIENIMQTGVGRRGRRKKAFTPLAWMQRRASAKDTASRGRRQGRGRGGFQLNAPDERDV